MNNKDILLSVCIPTYDGGDYLIENLNVLIPQLEKTEYGVELIISDNGTTEKNLSKLQNYLSKQSFPINFISTAENIGGRANFVKAVEPARGKYVFLLGDDDILLPNLLEIISPLLDSERYSLIHFNFITANESLQRPNLQCKIYEGCTKEMTAAEFLSTSYYDPTFMSSIVFLKECWDNGLPLVRDEYYGYEWFAAICHGIIRKPNPCLFYYFPLCIQRNPVKTWAKDTPIFKYIGQGFLFRDLDKIAPGLFDSKINFLRTSYFNKFLESVTADPKYFLKYEPLFCEMLDAEESKKLKRALHSPFYRQLHAYYVAKAKAKKIQAGLKRLIH